MPTYVYACDSCSAQFEQFQRFSDAPLTTCPRCEGSVRRVFQPVGIVFKGSGWYVTDSRGKNAAATPAASAGGEGSTSGESGASGESTTSSDTAASSDSSTSTTSSAKSDSPSPSSSS